MVRLFIDAGHGGKDSGAVGNGIKEKDITLKIALAIQDQLKNYQDVQLKMSRTKDEFLSLSQRTNLANSWGADAFLSIHINSASSTNARGFETFVYSSVNSRTLSFQDNIHREIMNVIDNYTDDDRGQKQANFHVLRESDMTACLTENLFISNSADAKLLKSNSFINALATGHTNGIVKYFNLKKKINSPSSPSSPSNTGRIYYVQVGAFSNEENAIELMDKLKKDGYAVFIKKEGRLHHVQIGAFTERENAIELEEKAKKDGYNVFIKIE